MIGIMIGALAVLVMLLCLASMFGILIFAGTPYVTRRFPWCSKRFGSKYSSLGEQPEEALLIETDKPPASVPGGFVIELDQRSFDPEPHAVSASLGQPNEEE